MQNVKPEKRFEMHQQKLLSAQLLHPIILLGRVSM